MAIPMDRPSTAKAICGMRARLGNDAHALDGAVPRAEAPVAGQPAQLFHGDPIIMIALGNFLGQLHPSAFEGRVFP